MLAQKVGNPGNDDLYFVGNVFLRMRIGTKTGRGNWSIDGGVQISSSGIAEFNRQPKSDYGIHIHCLVSSNLDYIDSQNISDGNDSHPYAFSAFFGKSRKLDLVRRISAFKESGRRTRANRKSGQQSTKIQCVNLGKRSIKKRNFNGLSLHFGIPSFPRNWIPKYCPIIVILL
jgi:hypothetical protein